MIELPADFVKPDYAAFCFSRIPDTIKSLLTGERTGSILPEEITSRLRKQYDAVILLYLDAFGWSKYEKFKGKSQLLQEIQARGTETCLTSQFPSTTAVQVATIHTGQPSGAFAALNWQYYEPLLDEIYFPLLNMTLGGSRRDSIHPSVFSPETVLPEETVYEWLAERGVVSRVFQHRTYTPSAYSDVIFKGAEVFPFKTLAEVLTNLLLSYQRQATPTYYFLYYDVVDAIGHEYGYESPQMEAEIISFLSTLDQTLFHQLPRGNGRTLFILTSDHGMDDSDPEKTIYLNLDPMSRDLAPHLRQNARGHYIIPGGSRRDMYLYIKPGHVEEARRVLSEALEDRAVVFSSKELIDLGLFGASPIGDMFLERIGDLVILPFAGESVWWHEKNRPEVRFRGHHGGLSSDEMYIPFLTLEI